MSLVWNMTVPEPNIIKSYEPTEDMYFTIICLCVYLMVVYELNSDKYYWEL